MTRRKRAAAGKAPVVGATFKNRIVGFEPAVDPATIKRNPLNWRVHPDGQRSAMRAALEQLGYVDVLIVNKRSGHLIDGEMRLDLSDENAQAGVPVLYVDLSPAEERLALATLNPMSELAGTDPELLGKLLAGREVFDSPLDELLRSLEEMALEASVKPTSASGKRAVGQSATHVMRIALEVPQVGEIERAIAMTGIANRGEALLELARSYIGDTERQHDPRPEDVSEDQLAQALRAGVADRS